jgi:CRP/FNR family transcriptional regulator
VPGGKIMNPIDKDLDYDSQKFENSPWLLKDFCDWSFIKKYGMMIHYKKGTILHSYDVMDSVFYLESGRVRTSVLCDEGEEKIILIVDKGNLFNLISVDGNIPDYVSYTAATDCVAYRISTDVFLDILKTDSKIAVNAMVQLSRVIKILFSHLGDMAFMRVPSRIAKYLYMLCQDHGTPTDNGIRINIKFTHYQMAILVGTSRVTVSHILEEMEQDKVLTKEGGYYFVKDLEKLKNYIIYQ